MLIDRLGSLNFLLLVGLASTTWLCTWRRENICSAKSRKASSQLFKAGAHVHGARQHVSGDGQLRLAAPGVGVPHGRHIGVEVLVYEGRQVRPPLLQPVAYLAGHTLPRQMAPAVR